MEREQVDTLARATRRIFDAHHRVQAADDAIFNRLTSLISPSYFGFEDDYFSGKVVLDAGCGSNANAAFAFLALGAALVCAADLGTGWMDCAREKLARFAPRFELSAQDVLALTLPEDRFDLVHCAGVLHHTADPEAGFRELARVTKPGGHLFVTIMANGDGVIYSCVNHLRSRYAEDASFRSAVDGLTEQTVGEALDWLVAARRAQGEADEEESRGEERFLRSLFDGDLVLTIKDRLQAPTYHDFDFTEAQVRSWFAAHGFSDVRRLSRYPHGFRNLRRFLAPMYHEYDHPLARFWFGEGYLQLIGRKWVEQSPA